MYTLVYVRLMFTLPNYRCLYLLIPGHIAIQLFTILVVFSICYVNYLILNENKHLYEMECEKSH